jgi:hypothetical protein
MQLWGPVNQAATSEKLLMKLTQTGSISAYYGEFMALAADLSWNEVPLVSRFYEGLKPVIKEMLVTFDKPQ